MERIYIMVFDKFKKMMAREEEFGDEFIEIDLNQEKSDSKVYVKTFTLTVYEDVNAILASLREGYNIVVVDIRPLKSKDVVELKRAISKLRKTCEAIDGDIAGFGEDYVMAVPYFAKIHRNKSNVLPE